MDISALLSPQDSPIRESSSPDKASPKKTRKPRTSSTPKVGASPLSKTFTPPALEASPLSGGTLSGGTQTRFPLPSPPTNGSSGSSHPLSISASNTPPADVLRTHRQVSTSGMDTLADLASMQHHQQAARANAGGLRSTEVYDTHLPTSTSLPSFLPLSRHHSASRVSIDVSLQDAPTQPSAPRIFKSASLSELELQTVSQLVSYLAENPYAYESHVQLVKLLHKGLMVHVRGTEGSTSPGDPHTYELVQDMRHATESMDARFTLGEDLWEDRLQALKLLANTLEECIGVVEAFKKAVTEETGSSRLWASYASWIISLYNYANPANQYSLENISFGNDISDFAKWSEEDRLIAAEAFTRKQVLDILAQGTEETKYRMNDSHLLWDSYADILLQDLRLSTSREGIVSLLKLFSDRLAVPHAKWEQTFQTFSTFVSTYESEAYEDIMVTVNRQSGPARKAYESREVFEIKWQRALDVEDKATEWSILTQYLEWERNEGRKQKAFSFHLSSALYQRALLRFSTDINLWEDYLMFIIDEGEHGGAHGVVSLPILERACRHCPWSGTLWSQYLQEAERENLRFIDIGKIKHKATSTGLLDAGGMEDVLKVHTAWCGYLRRRAFQRDSTDEEMDVAEVGIRSALEDMETLGRQKYGKEYQGDPEYRLERIYVKYLSQSRNWTLARDTWKELVARHGASYEFWIRYYNWEMLTWAKLSHANSVLPEDIPHEATKVLRRAIKRPDLDWPEKLMYMLMKHCEDHETVGELQHALNQVRKAKKALAKRREQDAQAAELAQQQQPQQTEPAEDAHNSSSNGKRKREEDEGVHEETPAKKNRAEVIESREPAEEQPVSVEPVLKRDRENCTIIVKNLPANTTELKVRQYFRDCGLINSIKLIPEDDHASATATIEFESKEDVLTAQTKDMKTFDGNSIEIRIGTGSTLYVTNFPPTADEAFVRDLFSKYGDIVSVRFPSLKYNKRRRFCYVQFKSSSQAQAATELNGTPQEGDLKLSVLISDPAHKKARSGALQEGRELHVSNVDWSATEDELSEIFSKYGEVERVRIPRDMGGKSKGFAFVVFHDKDSAESALDLDKTKFKSRLLQVTLSTNDPSKRQAPPTRQISKSVSRGPSAEPTSTSTAHSPPPPSQKASDPSLSASIAARTIALLNIPDTVSEARLRSLLSPYGALKKISLRLDHGGAIVEFEDEVSVGKASLGLEGTEIDGSAVRVGTVKELLKSKGEFRSDKIGIGGAGKKKEDGKLMLGSGVVRRPGLGASKRGGKGQLGVKGGGGGLSSGRAKEGAGAGVDVQRDDGNGDVEMDDGNEGTENKSAAGESGVPKEEGQRKSNADFKALFLKS